MFAQPESTAKPTAIVELAAAEAAFDDGPITIATSGDGNEVPALNAPHRVCAGGVETRHEMR